MHADAATRKSTITVKWENTKQAVADAVVKLGWGKNCGLLECSSYQKNGKSGAKGRITFTDLPSGNINWCVYATKPTPHQSPAMPLTIARSTPGSRSN